jgi:hypothetical protein
MGLLFRDAPLGVLKLKNMGLTPLLILALVLVSAAVVLVRRGRSRLAAMILSLLFLLTLCMLILGYAEGFYVLVSPRVLINPMVNLVLGRAPSLLGEKERSLLINLNIFRNNQEVVSRIGALFVWDVFVLSLAFFTWRLLGHCRSIMPVGHRKTTWILHWQARLLGASAGAYLVLGVAVWLPGAGLLLRLSGMPKVDVSIVGFEDLTSKVYLIEFAEYGDSFAFYVPTQQNIIRVAKQSVRYIVVKGLISPLANRAAFVKGPWIGVDDYAFTPLDKAESSAALRVTEVARPSPADYAGLVAGDVLLSLNGAPLKDPASLAEAVKAAPLDRPSEVVFLRKKETQRAALQVELRP